MDAAATCARSIGARLGLGGRGGGSSGGLGLPVYLYGAAHAEGRRLAEIRRRLGGTGREGHRGDGEETE